MWQWRARPWRDGRVGARREALWTFFMRSMDGPFSRPRDVSCVAHCCRSTCGAGRGTSQAAWGARRRPCPRIYGMTARRGGGGRCRVIPACVPVLRARCGISILVLRFCPSPCRARCPQEPRPRVAIGGVRLGEHSVVSQNSNHQITITFTDSRFTSPAAPGRRFSHRRLEILINGAGQLHPGGEVIRWKIHPSCRAHSSRVPPLPPV